MLVLEREREVYCPYCLHKEYWWRMQQYNAKGKLLLMLKCPECHHGFRKISTLLRDTDPASYAEWVFHYPPGLFFRQIQWEKWRRRLYELGWATAFWNRYHELKKENPSAKDLEEKAWQDYESTQA